jgi:hypothetical protein
LVVNLNEQFLSKNLITGGTEHVAPLEDHVHLSSLTHEEQLGTTFQIIEPLYMKLSLLDGIIVILSHVLCA